MDLLDGVSSLVDRSLLQRREQEHGELRFEMLETIREYGLERLAATGDVESTRRAQAAYCIVLTEEGLVRLLETERTEWLLLCEAEHGNLRAALDWLIETDNGEWTLRLGTALYLRILGTKGTQGGGPRAAGSCPESAGGTVAKQSSGEGSKLRGQSGKHAGRLHSRSAVSP